jgi:hypothetical protein
MTPIEASAALVEIAKKINGFLAPMGGYVCGDLSLECGRHTPAMRLTVGFPEERLKECLLLK